VLAAIGIVFAGCLAAAAPASAAVTSSTLTVNSPTGSYLIDDQIDSNAEEISVGGTTNGRTGDAVDIKCYSGGGSQTLASAVPVDASGAFSYSGSFRPISRQTCVLRAVRAGDTTDYPPGSASPYSGPVLNIGQATETRVASTNDLEYYYLYVSQLAGAFEYASLGGCSISESYDYDPTTFGGLTQYQSESLDFCNAWFSWANGGLKSGQAPPTRSELQVDGVDAYVAGNAFGINGLSTYKNSGYPSLTYSYSIDPATGDLSLNETDQVVRCLPGGMFPPDAAHCSSFAPTGVQVVMHIVQDQSGRVVKVVQWFQSTDGKPHSVDALEDNDFYHRNQDGELDFPWTGGGMAPYTVPGQVLAGPSSPGPGSFFVKGSASVPDGSSGPNASPQGQVTFSDPPSSETIVSTTNNEVNTTPPAAISWVDLHYTLTVPGTGPGVPLGFAYSNAYSAAQVGSDASAAQAAFLPKVSISSPKSGIDTAAGTVTVSGTAADATGLSGVTVNGRAVPVASSGTWSTAVGLRPGLNTISAVASNVFANKAQAQTIVVYIPPPAVAALHQAHRTWRESGHRARHKPAIGTTFSWTLNEPAQLRFVFTEQVPGRRSDGRCVAQDRRNRSHRACSRTITVGTQTLSAGAGRGQWSFRGRMRGGRALAPGTYTVTLVASTPSTGAQSTPTHLRFTIVR
jgi:Glucodextranase, domain B